MNITFSDILIEPQYSEVLSRSNVDLTSHFNNFSLRLPIFSANMKTVTGCKMANEMAEHGAMGILHRFNTIKEAVQDFEQVKGNTYTCAVSVGVKKEDCDRIIALYNAGARIFCIDIAHGHHILMKRMIDSIRQLYGGKVTIIAGNVATSDGAYDLHTWGADIIKVGIGSGHACLTRRNTGVGVSQFTALQRIREECKTLRPLKLISDGGIKTVGDIAKALIYADGVMLGSMLSGSAETPGSVFRDTNNLFYKVYGGSASGENKVESGHDGHYVEGVTSTVPFKGHVKYILREIREGLQSALSYCNSHDLNEYKQKVKFSIISGGSKQESKYA